jgi:hypothetical protein
MSQHVHPTHRPENEDRPGKQQREKEQRHRRPLRDISTFDTAEERPRCQHLCRVPRAAARQYVYNRHIRERHDRAKQSCDGNQRQLSGIVISNIRRQ